MNLIDYLVYGWYTTKNKGIPFGFIALDNDEIPW